MTGVVAAAGQQRGTFVAEPGTPIIITIDGPAGTGKSSVARDLARRLGLDFLDTGAMYRASAAIAMDHRIELTDRDGIVRAVAGADLRFDWSADPPAMLAYGRSIDHRLRAPDVTAIVSEIAAIGELRRLLVDAQRQIAREHPRLVTEGRDQGSVVFPDAPVKFYLHADAGVRMQRRAEQLRRAGLPADEASLLRDIIERDRIDSSRADGPLIVPRDAERVDTSSLSFPEVVDHLEAIVRRQFAGR